MNKKTLSLFLPLLAFPLGEIRAEMWFGNALLAPLPGTPVNAAVGDLDGVSGLDLVAGTTSDVIWLLENDGAGQLSYRGTLASPGASAHVATGDVNGDGIGDIVGAPYQPSNGVRVFLGQGGGVFEEAMLAESEFGVARLACHDIDGDGMDDVVGARPGRIEVYWGTPEGVSGPQLLSFSLGSCAPGGVEQLLFVDSDGDPYLDIVFVADASQGSCEIPSIGGIGRFRGQADRQFGVVEWLATAEYVHSYDSWTSGAAGDIDGDGDLDFVIGRSSPLLTFLGAGPGTWLPGPPGELISSSTSGLVDFDGNGTLDIVGVSTVVLSGDGDGHFSVVGTVGVGNPILGAFEMDGVPGLDLVSIQTSFQRAHVRPNRIWQDPADVPPHGGVRVEPIMTVRPTVWTGRGDVTIGFLSPEGSAFPVPPTLSIVDALGRIAEVLEAADVSNGREVRWSPSPALPTGTYWVRSDLTSHVGRIVVVR